MWNRRRTLQTGLATLLSAAAPLRAFSQPKPRVKVRYNEVVRSMLYAPAYVAIAKGYFEEPASTSRWRRRRAATSRWRSCCPISADIALIGPESAIYVQNSDSPIKIPIFCGLTATDGFMLVGREKVDKFDWSMLKGKEILGFRPGSTPLLFLEAALRQNGLDPQKDVKLMNNVGIPARVGSWLAGQNQYAIFIEPDASQLELDGKAHFLASIGETVGPADYTTFMATDKYIRENPATSRTGPTRSPRAEMDGGGAGSRDGQGARAVLPGREPEGAGGVRRTLPQAEDLEDLAGDRAGADREVPGHPGAGPRAGAGASA